MKTTSFENYLSRFVAEYIKGLPQSFNSIQDFRTALMLLFNGWQLLKKCPEYSSTRFKALEDVLKAIDQFDNTLERPLEMKTIRSIANHPKWREIRTKIQMLPF